MYFTGTGKGDITAFVKGAGMLGYGIHYNTAEGVETPLSARAYVFRDPNTGRKICFVNCELCFITIAIKKGVLKTLDRKFPEFNYDEDNYNLNNIPPNIKHIKINKPDKIHFIKKIPFGCIVTDFYDNKINNFKAF